MNFIKKNWLTLFLLSLLVFIVYVNSLGNVFISDDIFGIVQNQRWGNLNYILSNPLGLAQGIFYYLAVKLGGYTPFYFRLFNIFFHIGSVFLLYYLIYKLYGKVTALFAASIFAVHPVLVESVSWISGGGYVKYGFFLLLSFITYLGSSESKKKYFLSLIFFFILLTDTPLAVALPLILVVYDFMKGTLSKNWKRLIPYFIMTVLFLVLTFTGSFQNKVANIKTSAYQAPGIDNPVVQIPIAVVNYISLITFPKDLTLYHTELAFSFSQYLFVAALFIIFLAVTAISYKKNKEVFFWFSFFILSLSPTLTPFRITWAVAERYAYVAILGIIVPIAILLKEIYSNKKTRIYAQAIFLIIIIVFAMRSIIRNFDWKTDETFWKVTAEVSPSSFYAHNNLGDALGKRGDQKASAEEFMKAIALNPGYAPAYHNVANVYRVIGKEDLAIEYYQKSLKIDPALWQTYLNLGALYFSHKDYKKSEELMLKAIKFAPWNGDLYYNLGVIYVYSGDKKRAKQAFSEALKIRPDDKKLQRALVDVELLP